MCIPGFIRRWLLCRANAVMKRREPDFIIGDNYLRRWWMIPRNRWLNVYLHEFHRSDDDRALHDHPWASCSLILSGSYIEHVPADTREPAGSTTSRWRQAGHITPRRSRAAHRIELPDNAHLNNYAPVITLFVTGPRVRDWGFWCPKGWKHWKQFTAPGDKGQVGPGCGED